MSRRHEESNIQQGLIKWWHLAHNGLNVKDEFALMAFPLGGKRSLITGAIMKAEGARAGTPDMFLAVARGGYHGLWIELKTKTGIVSDAQKQFLLMLKNHGYCAVIMRGFDDAKHMIEDYLALRCQPAKLACETSLRDL